MEDCSSFLTGFTRGIIRSQDHLFFSTTLSTSKMAFKEMFVKTDLDGTNMSTIYEIPISEQYDGSVEYVVHDEKLYYSFYDSGIFSYDVNSGKSKLILESNNDTFGFWDFQIINGFTFRAESFYDDKTDRVYKNAFLKYSGDEFKIIDSNVDDLTVLVLTEKFKIKNSFFGDSKLNVEYPDGTIEELTDDFKYFTPGGYIISDDKVILNYLIVDEDRTRTRTVLYKYADDKLIKIDEVESDNEVNPLIGLSNFLD